MGVWTSATSPENLLPPLFKQTPSFTLTHTHHVSWLTLGCIYKLWLHHPGGNRNIKFNRNYVVFQKKRKVSSPCNIICKCVHPLHTCSHQQHLKNLWTFVNIRGFKNSVNTLELYEQILNLETFYKIHKIFHKFINIFLLCDSFSNSEYFLNSYQFC